MAENSHTMTATDTIKSTGTLEFEEYELGSDKGPAHAVLFDKLIAAGFPLQPTLIDWMYPPRQARQDELIRAALKKCGAKEIIRSVHPSGTLTFHWR